ncbi:G-type lectin S-receptor-like serine/threonine-protein kinase At4g27290 isoform X2 [Magnolia sinica]|uniref:G-type lectin S-receptor-like serine/threonine-protein kinase At4g27290 isoform X2 n=1 Tax=Magnolia sinica TaxID=86752 RepID=UPI00265A0CB7|nr:G-type lectin S-receptor-like serine/threonine-protein kinase At4g27290 isoform X2 [Magnolia sinica]
MAFHISLPNSLLILTLLFPSCTSIDTIIPSKSIKDGETLISGAGTFELGFFSPGNSTRRYVGIWYKKAPPEKKYVWVANRDDPLTNSSGVLSIGPDGNLAVLIVGWPAFPITNASTVVNSTSATLLDNGNLVLKDNQDRVLWQSFDYPTDTMLPGMKIGLNRKTGMMKVLTSWKSDDDPASGDYVIQLDPRGSPQFFVWKGSDAVWRSGPWNGPGFSGIPLMNRQNVVTYHFTVDDQGIYFSYDLNGPILSRLRLDSSGNLQRWAWQDDTPRWTPFWWAPNDQCDEFEKCGANSCCDVNRAVMCECLQGFKPKMPEAWNLHDWSGGCDRRQGLACGKGDGFKKMENVKLPDTSAARVARVSGLRECRDECLKNCSCTAYASADIEKWGGECLIWYGDLIDLKLYSDDGMDLYVRLAGSELDSSPKRKKLVLILVLTVIPGTLLLFWCGYCLYKRKYQKKGNAGLRLREGRHDSFSTESEKSSEMPLFNLVDVVIATDHFSQSNKLGEGGFGPVYKGKLRNGQQIAVKRLSRNSGQGVEEFKNEVVLIQQLQHRNLVKILGCCIQGEEKMLIYEYMQNKSLDSFIFDETKAALLDWRKRFDIIIGIARGVLYLHHDSRLRIIHRDLKASNILLDDEMNPKISDFGMARIFSGNQTQGNTNRVVGTYGYMSPEYAIDGLFSVKSDVYSFGVLLLEIISGKRNNGYHNPDSNLMGHAWELWNEGRSLELLDSVITDSCPSGEVLRCIHVGLLCVQENAINRPTMLAVVSMLGNETAIPPPKKPAYSSKRNFFDSDSSTSWAECHSTNGLTITELRVR